MTDAIGRKGNGLFMEARRRILAVEDDPEAARRLVELLTANGYQVDLAVNGNHALSRGRSESYSGFRSNWHVACMSEVVTAFCTRNSLYESTNALT
jgi:CheY-like chemotaxis protein